MGFGANVVIAEISDESEYMSASNRAARLNTLSLRAEQRDDVAIHSLFVIARRYCRRCNRRNNNETIQPIVPWPLYPGLPRHGCAIPRNDNGAMDCVVATPRNDRGEFVYHDIQVPLPRRGGRKPGVVKIVPCI